MFLTRKKARPAPVGRDAPAFRVPERHAVLGTPLKPPFPEGIEIAVFGLGCFWGAERLFWRLGGVHSTAVGYAGGATSHPTYREVCGGRTGHAEVVQVAFDPLEISYRDLLRVFWEGHDPTQGDRQGNDRGTQYRSIILAATDAQLGEAEQSRDRYEQSLIAAGRRPITTQIARLGHFFYAEENHQQYLHKVPAGYCGLRGTGVACVLGDADPAAA